MLENLILAPIWACWDLTWVKKVFLKRSALLDVFHCPKLQSCAISKKTKDTNLRKWRKT